MPMAEHRVEVLDGDDPLVMPTTDDPRLTPFLKNLRELGLMDRQGKLTKEDADVCKGVLGQEDITTGERKEFYFWRIEWKD